MEYLASSPTALFTCPPAELGSTGQPCFTSDRKSELALDYTLPDLLPGSVDISLPPFSLPRTKCGYQYSIRGEVSIREREQAMKRSSTHQLSVSVTSFPFKESNPKTKRERSCSYG